MAAALTEDLGELAYLVTGGAQQGAARQERVAGVALLVGEAVGWRVSHLWGSRSRPELVTCSDRRPTLQA
jgi:hypothetical protein